jgi:hypothetical protein
MPPSNQNNSDILERLFGPEHDPVYSKQRALYASQPLPAFLPDTIVALNFPVDVADERDADFVADEWYPHT